MERTASRHRQTDRVASSPPQAKSKMAASLLHTTVGMPRHEFGTDIIYRGQNFVQNERGGHQATNRAQGSFPTQGNSPRNQNGYRDPNQVRRAGVNYSGATEVKLLKGLCCESSPEILGALTRFLHEDYLIRVLNEDVDSDDGDENSDKRFNDSARKPPAASNTSSVLARNFNPANVTGEGGKILRTTAGDGHTFPAIKIEPVSPTPTEPNPSDLSPKQGGPTRRYSEAETKQAWKPIVEDEYIKMDTSLPKQNSPVLNKAQQKLIPLREIRTYGQRAVHHGQEEVTHFEVTLPAKPRLTGSYNIASLLGTVESSDGATEMNSPLDLSIKHDRDVVHKPAVVQHASVIRLTPTRAELETFSARNVKDDLKCSVLPGKSNCQSQDVKPCPTAPIEHQRENPPTTTSATHSTISTPISEQKALQRKIASVVPKKRRLVEMESCNYKPLKKRIVGNLSSPNQRIEAKSPPYDILTPSTANTGTNQAVARKHIDHDVTPTIDVTASNTLQAVGGEIQSVKTGSDAFHSSPHSRSYPPTSVTRRESRETSVTRRESRETSVTRRESRETSDTRRESRERSSTPEDVNLQDFASDVIDRVYSDSGSGNESPSSPKTSDPTKDPDSRQNTKNMPESSESGTLSPTQSPDLSSKTSKNGTTKRKHKANRPSNPSSPTNHLSPVNESSADSSSRDSNAPQKVFSITDIITNMIEAEYSNSDDGHSDLGAPANNASLSDAVGHSVGPRDQVYMSRSLRGANPRQCCSDFSEGEQCSDPEYLAPAMRRRKRMFPHSRTSLRTLSDNDVPCLRANTEQDSSESGRHSSSNESEVFSDEEDNEMDGEAKTFKKWEQESKLPYGTVYSCRHGKCNKAFSMYKYLRSHRNSHHQCTDCNKQFSIRPSLMSHMKFHNQGRFLCELCSTSFHFNLTYQKHKTNHVTETPFACNLCGRAFSTQLLLNLHKMHEEKERKYACGICSHSFIQRQELAQHMNTKHRCMRFKCRKCRATYQELYQLKKHELRKHHEDSLYACTCGKAYNSWTMYSKCVLSHQSTGSDGQPGAIPTLGPRVYACITCHEPFSSIGQLRSHTVSHMTQGA